MISRSKNLNPNFAVNSVFWLKKETCPWTELGDAMYSMPVGSIFRTFPSTKFIKFICLPPEEEDGSEPNNNQNQ